MKLECICLGFPVKPPHSRVVPLLSAFESAFFVHSHNSHQCYTVEPMDMAGKPNPLPPVGPLVDGDVKVIHADSLRPSLVGDRWIWVRVTGGALQAVKFYFPEAGIGDVQQALETKYGAPTRIEKRYLDRRSDGRLDFYIATWVRPKLTVVLTSLDVDMDMGGSASTTGHVRVDYGPPVRKIEQNSL